MEQPICVPAAQPSRRRWTSLLAWACLIAPITAQAPRLTIVREPSLDGGTSRCARYAPDGRLVASGGELGDLLVLDAETGAVLHRFEGGRERIRSLASSTTEPHLIARGEDLRSWDLEDGSPMDLRPAQPERRGWTRSEGIDRVQPPAPGRTRGLRWNEPGHEPVAGLVWLQHGP